VFHVRKEFLNMGIELGELPLEKLELCDHRADEQIESRILAAASQAFLCRLSERFGFFCSESTAAGADEQALKPTQREPGDSGRARSHFEHSMGRFAVVILKMTAELGEVPIDQSGEPTLGIAQLMADKTPLPA
jgi:hypothetical protein